MYIIFVPNQVAMYTSWMYIDTILRKYLVDQFQLKKWSTFMDQIGQCETNLDFGFLGMGHAHKVQ